MERRRLIVGADVQGIARFRGGHLPDHAALRIVDDVAVAIEHDAPPRAEYRAAARTPEGLQPVAALPVPDDGLSTRELERRFLGVGNLPVVVEIVPASRRHDPRTRIGAEGPA